MMLKPNTINFFTLRARTSLRTTHSLISSQSTTSISSFQHHPQEHNQRSFSSSSLSDDPQSLHQSLITKEEGVHQSMKLSKSWRRKPLFRRQGDVRFKTGIEAANLLIKEAKRRDDHEEFFIDSVSSTMQCLGLIFDRNPRYAFVAKQLMEPERFIQFRVAWIDDVGVVRMNRGYRCQYSSSLGPYEGALHFGSHVNSGFVKALGFDSVFSNSLTGYSIGAAVGGSDFVPYDKSDAELQRFCHSYMTELAKYVGPDIDQPTMGMGVGETEMGYLYGQYKRINMKGTSGGKPFLASGSTSFYKAPGFGVVHFADNMLKDKGDSLKGKRCLIIGSGKVARSVAEKLLDFGAIPLTFSDNSGFIYEPDGIDEGKLRTINKIKTERGALLGRYIISSTSAKFNDPGDIFDIPCDLCFPCAAVKDIDGDHIAKLADNGCMGVIEGGASAVTPEARLCLKKRGILYGPHTLTMTGSLIATELGRGANDVLLAQEVSRIYKEVKQTATEFNKRGDLFVGANISGFLRVANVMLTHGAV